MRIRDGRNHWSEKGSGSAIGTDIGMETIAGKRLSLRLDLNTSQKALVCWNIVSVELDRVASCNQRFLLRIVISMCGWSTRGKFIIAIAIIVKHVFQAVSVLFIRTID